MTSEPEETDEGSAKARQSSPSSTELPGEEVSPTSPQEGKPTETSKAPQQGSMFTSQAEMLADVAGNTARIVYRAATILEEELNTGIDISRRIEKKYIDVDKLRSDNPEAVMQRFRGDAHDVVDILLDLVNVATNSLGDLTQRLITIKMGEPRTGEQAKPVVGIPSLEVPTPVKAGDSVEIPMSLENESNQPTEVFNLVSSDLINNTNGERITAQQISFSPDKLVLEPKKSATVTVIVRVPEDTQPGVYSGLLQATRLDQLRAVLSIQIE